MRLFVAVNLPAALRDQVYADIAALREATDAVKWVAPAQLHVTLRFLGETAATAVGPLRNALATLATRHAVAEVELTGVGAFPNFRRPRVVWIGMAGARTLEGIARDVEKAVRSLGFEAERRPFRPHLTIGRVKRELRGTEVAALTGAAEASRTRRAFAVRSVDLMQSEMAAAGSRYTVLASAPLHVRG